MPDPGRPPDLLAPAVPIIERRRRPITVTLARGFLLAGAAVGLVSAITLLLSVGSVAAGFEFTAARAAVDPAEIGSVAHLVRTVLASSGAIAAALAVGTVVAAVGIGRGRRRARGAALCLVALSLCFGLGSASYTTLGRRVDWTGDGSAQLRAQIGQAYGDAMPDLLVGTTGGLTDLQALSYIAGAALLLAPASRPHFRRRAVAAPPANPSSERGSEPRSHPERRLSTEDPPSPDRPEPE
jgi:hypothetical protein